MTEPAKLTREQLLPLAVAAERRQAAILAGQSNLLQPLPDCPTCGQPANKLAVRQDYRIDLTLVHIAIDPCAHQFTAADEDIYEVYDQARQIALSDTPSSKENSA